MGTGTNETVCQFKHNWGGLSLGKIAGGVKCRLVGLGMSHAVSGVRFRWVCR